MTQGIGKDMLTILLALVLSASSTAQEEFSFRSKYDFDGCSPAAPRRHHKSSEVSACTAVALEEANDEALDCVFHLRSKGPECINDSWKRERQKMTGEVHPRKNNITLYLDIKFGLQLEKPEWLTGGYNGRIRCLRTIMMSYRETLPAKCGDHILPLRRTFQWFPGNGELPTSFEVIDSVPIGSANIDEDCIQRDEGQPSACRIRAKIRWSENLQDNGQLSFTGKLVDASMENKKTSDYSHALEMDPQEFETPELSKISNIKSNFIAYDGNNKWHAIYSVMSAFKNIHVLNISGSPIKFFAMAILSDKHQLQDLIASSCAIRLIEEDAFKHNTYLKHIDLSKNELNFIPQNIFKDLKFLTYLNLSHNKFTQGQGLNFYVNKEWPDCGLQLLDISSNSLVKASNLIGYGNKVRSINLANNLLKDLSSMVAGRSIKELDLSGNRIETLSQSSLETLELVDYLDLTKNMFDCGSCNLLNLQNWLNTSGRNILASPPEDLICWSPIQLRYKEKKVLAVQYDGKPCIDEFGTNSDKEIFRLETLNKFIFFLLTTSIFTLVTATLTLYHHEVYQYTRKVIRHLIHRWKKEYIYDASISYSAGDESWVLHELRPMLEDGGPRYKLFLIDRELELGKIMKKYVKMSTQRCRKSIIILSKDYVDSEWTNQERSKNRISCTSQENLILISRDEIDKHEIPQSLQSLMNEVTYLEWPKKPSTEITNATCLDEREDSSPEKKFHPENISTSYEESLQLFWKDLFEALGISLFIDSSSVRDIDDHESKNDPKESNTTSEGKYKKA